MGKPADGPQLSLTTMEETLRRIEAIPRDARSPINVPAGPTALEPRSTRVRVAPRRPCGRSLPHRMRWGIPAADRRVPAQILSGWLSRLNRRRQPGAIIGATGRRRGNDG